MKENTEYLFNNLLRERTMIMASGVFDLISQRKFSTIQRPIIIQLIKSSSSVAANYRAATRARSMSEYYAKICIVVEECDESHFWMEFLIRTRVLTAEDCKSLYSEIDELVRIFSTIKRKVKTRLEGKAQTAKP
jgi:four helix bundle protein